MDRISSHLRIPKAKASGVNSAFEVVTSLKQKDGRMITTAWLRSNFSISYGRASALIDQLEAAGIISAPDEKTHRRHVL